MKKSIEYRIVCRRIIFSVLLSMALLFQLTSPVSASQEDGNSGIMVIFDVETRETTARTIGRQRTSTFVDVPEPNWPETPVNFHNNTISPFNARNVPHATVVHNTMVRPYSGVVNIRTTWPHGPATYATGFLYGPNSVATVGHNLFNIYRGGWANWIEVIPARNGLNSAPFGTYFAVTMSVHGSWFQSRLEAFDIGFIHLNSSVHSANIFSLTSPNDASLNGLSVTATGYPEYASVVGSMWRSFGRITSAHPNSLVSTHPRDSGLSGSPVYNSFGSVIGIHQGNSPGNNSHVVRMTWSNVEFLNQALWMW